MNNDTITRWSIIAGAVLFASLLYAPFLLVSLFVLFCYGWIKAIKWSCRQDRSMRDLSKLDRSLIYDLRLLDQEIFGTESKVKSRFRKWKSLWSGNSPEGQLRCIVCGNPSNKDGYFCKDHEE